MGDSLECPWETFMLVNRLDGMQKKEGYATKLRSKLKLTWHSMSLFPSLFFKWTFTLEGCSWDWKRLLIPFVSCLLSAKVIRSSNFSSCCRKDKGIRIFIYNDLWHCMVGGLGEWIAMSEVAMRRWGGVWLYWQSKVFASCSGYRGRVWIGDSTERTWCNFWESSISYLLVTKLWSLT